MQRYKTNLCRIAISSPVGAAFKYDVVTRLAMIEMISVHVPKCAGSSLKSALMDVFGESNVYQDYADRPLDPSAPVRADPEKFFAAVEATGYGHLAASRVVHGHFHARKYQNLKSRHRIAFLREPIDRLVSHYYYWRNAPRHGHTLHDYVLDNDLGIEEFAALPPIKAIYTDSFFGGANMAAFDFIGFYEDYETDLARLSKMLGLPLRYERTNANEDDVYEERRRAILDDSQLMSRLRDTMRADIEFVERLRHGRAYAM
jgi:hypothetical protein